MGGELILDLSYSLCVCPPLAETGTGTLRGQGFPLGFEGAVVGSRFTGARCRLGLIFRGLRGSLWPGPIPNKGPRYCNRCWRRIATALFARPRRWKAYYSGLTASFGLETPYPVGEVLRRPFTLFMSHQGPRVTRMMNEDPR